MPDALRLSKSRTPNRGPLCVPEMPNNREGSQQGSPLRARGRSYRESLAKEAFQSPVNKGSKKDSERAVNSCGGGSLWPCTLGATRVPASQAAAPPSRSALAGAELPQAKKVLRLCARGRLSHIRLFAAL